MSEQIPVLTVRTEVESLLRFTVERYTDVTTTLDALTPAGTDFHDAVIAELEGIIEAYVNSEPAEPTPLAQFEVGDHVRLTGADWNRSSYGDHPSVGDVVEIIEIDEDGDAVFLDEDGERWYTGPGEGVGTQGDSYNAVKVDTEIHVGDTVRITEAYEKVAGSDKTGNLVGVTFQVTEIHDSTYDLIGAEFYVEGDPSGRGIWNTYIEKVYA